MNYHGIYAYIQYRTKNKDMIIELGTLGFGELTAGYESGLYNDMNSAVFTALSDCDEKTAVEINKFLRDEIRFSQGKELSKVLRLGGGKGDFTCWLMTFTGPAVPFNPIARLKFTDIKWTGDFIDSFGKLYE